MLLFLTAVNAIYIYHRHTKKFLGVEKRPDFPDRMIVPVNDPSKALSFRLSEGGVNPSNNTQQSTLKELMELPPKHVIRILHPSENLSFDAWSGSDRNGNRLIAYPSHNGSAQKMLLRGLINLGFAIGWNNRCFVYSAAFDGFQTGSCDELNNSVFDFYTETSSATAEGCDSMYLNRKSSKGPQGQQSGSGDMSMLPYGSDSDKFINSPEDESTKFVFRDNIEPSDEDLEKARKKQEAKAGVAQPIEYMNRHDRKIINSAYKPKKYEKYASSYGQSRESENSSSCDNSEYENKHIREENYAKRGNQAGAKNRMYI